jgi:hypothetical protein
MLRSQFSAIFVNFWQKNWRVFLKNQCYDQIFAKTANIFAIFCENTKKIIT